MNSGAVLYADVILPLALQHLYTYSVPSDFETAVSEGKRVVVQFGNQKLYTALVYRIHRQKPEHYETKEIISVLDALPVVNRQQFDFWEWIAQYYLCSLGEVMAAALSPGMKMESETRVVLHPAFNGVVSHFSEMEYKVFRLLEEHQSLTLQKLSKLSGKRNLLPIINQLMEKEAVIRKEELKNSVRPLTIEVVEFTDQAASNEEFLAKAFAAIEKRAPKQLQLLLFFIKMKTERPEEPVIRKNLLIQSGSTLAILEQLIKKNILEVNQLDKWLMVNQEKNKASQPELSPVQEAAFRQIKSGFDNHLCTLLHGVTSSGKTEIFIRLIEEQIRQGKQVLYLLPEIALTTQIITRLKKYFGERTMVYHSKYNEKERVTVWNNMIHFQHHHTAEDYQVIIGARSALFLPFTNLGLIIVDEEHDSSYKQTDPAPRYNARDAAIKLGQMQHAKVILGSATPAMESYYNAVHGKYALVKLNQRHSGITMPLTEIVDIRDASRRKKMKSIFSETLLNAIEQSLASHEQVILFQNRRGFSPVLECQNCHWVPHCIHCDVTLTYHKTGNKLICHYCGYSMITVHKCPACGDQKLKLMGYGTERIEDDLKLLFPNARVSRLDLDTTRSHSAYQNIIHSFENRQIDILVGTQMVTKGLDFNHVNLVGVMNADNMLNFPDFRSIEKCFQLLMQVSGRAGRRNKQGKVIIQTWQPRHPVIEYVRINDYDGFYEFELHERLKFNYPPFYRLIQIKLKHRNENQLEENSLQFAVELKQVFGDRVLGPVIPFIPRIRNYHLRHILLKIERKLLPDKIKSMLNQVMDAYLLEPRHRSLIIQIDVDPM
ncbi:MAG: primosomal protein N' [Bacteroidia bacterium]|nr:primosomal protein N' [Bacteroidia bacterium]MCZ2277339.1 primosomal protein N' [Bacteroidia bacterium]